MEVKRKTSNHNVNSNRKYDYSAPQNSDIFDQSSYNIMVRTPSSIINSKVRNGTSGVNGDTQEATELTKLRPRTSAANLQTYMSDTRRLPPPDDVVYLEREILPTDTLQSFALLYGCTLNDIKRANNLITEQDFYALRIIKIPVKRHGLLTEPSEEQKRRSFATTSLTGKTTTDDKVDDEPAKSTHLDSVYHSVNGDFDSGDSLENLNLLDNQPKNIATFKNIAVERNDTSKYLKKVDKEIRKTVRKNDELHSERNEVLEEVVSSLGSVGYRPLLPPGSHRHDDCDGSDWGLKWWVILICFVVVIIVFVLIMVEFYLNYSEMHSSNRTTPS
uniref:LysM and putative peptidoglycan-binding domain-containing protein 3 n=1 Tax=Phallusia mammillata TaxID=59560 RepID=A0A6F9DKS1_9ASCI|nr:lysM and putative peptidoglycan-binding domain-containing protein 3 [Phallusia mammillata]